MSDSRDVSGVSGSQIQPRIKDIQDAAIEYFGITRQDFLSPSRKARVAWPRQVAMYYAKTLTGRNLSTIAISFHKQDHTTVLHAVRKVQGLLDEEPLSSDGKHARRRMQIIGFGQSLASLVQEA